MLLPAWRRPLAAVGLGLLLAGPAAAQTDGPRLVPFRQGTRWGFADHARRVVVPLQYDEVGAFVGELAWVRQGTRYGYLDSGGNRITPVQYSRASDFRQGRATVELNGETFDIDPSGNRLATPPPAPPDYDYLEQGDLLRQNGKVGFRFTSGSSTVVPAEYDEIRDLHHDGLLLVRQGQKWGILNAKGKATVPVEYDAIRATAANGFLYPVVEREGRFGYLDNEGRLLTDVKYTAAEPFSADVARVTTPDGQTGYIDNRGREFWEQ